MPKPLAVLIVEDSESDAQLIVRLLKKAGYEVVSEQVETAAQMRAALEKQAWDIVISDYALPQFDGRAALTLLHEMGLDIPFIVVSGMIGEEIAVTMMKAGAHDYLMKGSLARLAPAIKREFAQGEIRRERKQAEQALRESEEKHSRVLKGVDEIIYQINFPEGSSVVNGRVEFVSERTQEILGYRPAEFITDPNRWFNLIHPEDIPTVQAQTTSLMKTGQPSLRSYRIKDTNGEYRWLEDRVSPQKDKTGRVVRIFGVARDVTERMRSENDLHESEARYRSLFEHSHDLIWSLALDGSFLFVNNSWHKTLGYSAEDLEHLNVFDIIHPDSLPHYQPLFAQVISGIDVPAAEVTFVAKDGRLVITEGSISPRLLDGKVIATHAFFRDITERKQAEEVLRQSEEKYHTLVEQASDGIFIADADGNYIEVNSRSCEMLGYTRAEILQLKISDLMEPSELERAPLRLDELRQGKALLTERTFVRKNGDTFPTEISAKMFPNGQLQAIVRDITERKQAEEALRNAEARYRVLFEQSPNGILLIDLDTGKTIEANETAHKQLGYTREEFAALGISDYEVLEKPEETARHMQKVIREGSDDFETRHRTKSGEVRNMHVWAKTVQLSDRAFFYGIFQDITERKEAEKQIQTQLQRLASLHAIDITIASSFDLRVILNIVTKQALDQLDVDAASVLLLDPYMQTLQYAAGNGFRTRAVEKASIRLGESFAGRAALERRIIQVNDSAEVQASLHFATLWKGEGFAAYCAVPLISKGKVKGVLEVFQRTPLSLKSKDGDWLNFFETLAGQAAIAVDNIELFDGMQRANMELGAAYEATIAGWSQAMDLRDKETEGHTQRVTEMAVRLAQAMGISGTELVHIRRGALLHDIGKMGVPDNILLKPGKLTDEEWVFMKKHPQFAYDMLSSIAYLKPALDIPYCHHEKWDGTGYPRGLKGEQIPLAACLFAVVDVWDALRSDRPYRKGWPDEKVLEHIRSLAGTHFDPKVVDVFLSIIDKQ